MKTLEVLETPRVLLVTTMTYRTNLFFLPLLIIVWLTAACNSAPPPPTEESGRDVLQRMQVQLEAIPQAQTQGAFALATAEGGLQGGFELWLKQPDQFRLALSSDEAPLDGVSFGFNDNDGYWAYDAEQNVLFTAPDDLTLTQFNQYPELRTFATIIQHTQQLSFDEAYLTTKMVGEAEINGRPTYQIEARYLDLPSELAGLDDLVVTFWVDVDHSLPHKVEVTLAHSAGRFSGAIVLTHEIDQTTDLADDQFVFVPEGTVRLIQLADLPK